MTHNSLHHRRGIANACLSTALLLCAVLFLFPPTRTGLYPACPFHQYLSIDCPGCGATRALAALLHGHFIEALHLNALFVLLFPIALASAIEAYRQAIRPGYFRFPIPPTAAIYTTLAATAVFTVARNVLR